MKTTRVGLTSIEIDFLKEAYARDPNVMGLNTMDLLGGRCNTPLISQRMQREIDSTFNEGQSRPIHHGTKPKRTMTPV
jgi:hypothetical protein